MGTVIFCFFNCDGFRGLKMNSKTNRGSSFELRFKNYLFIKEKIKVNISLCLHSTIQKNQILLFSSSSQNPMKTQGKLLRRPMRMQQPLLSIHLCISIIHHHWQHSKKRGTGGETQYLTTRHTSEVQTAAKPVERREGKVVWAHALYWVTHAVNSTEQTYPALCRLFLTDPWRVWPPFLLLEALLPSEGISLCRKRLSRVQ